MRIRTNRILEKNRQGRKAMACGFIFPSPEIVELIGMSGGFDSIGLDGEHGTFSPESIDVMCRAADAFGLTVTARVPNISAPTVNSFLDRGVIGITGPHIQTAQQAGALVAACRFAPEGARSWGGGRGTFYNDGDILEMPGTERTAYMQQANREMMVVAQLETAAALENLDELLAVEGIDAFAWGANDLAQSMGFVGQPEHPEVVAAMSRTAERIHRAGRKLSFDLMETATLPALVLDGARGFLADQERG